MPDTCPATEFRVSSLDTVDGARPIRLAIARTDSPAATPTAISSRSANDRYRPCRFRPRRGLTPPAAASNRRPVLRLVPTASAASLRNWPACNAAQNRCTNSGRYANDNSATTLSTR